MSYQPSVYRFYCKPSLSCAPKHVKLSEPAGLTCQLCDTTGHAAKSCPTYLNEVEARRTALEKVDALEATLKRQQQRLAALDDQVKGLRKDMDWLEHAYEEAPKCEEDEEEWDDYKIKRYGDL